METLIKSSREDLSAIDSIDQDLLLAAEIGKTLLEKNRELELILKTTQDFADEKTAQTEFYLKQVEILRESNDSCQHSCEALESSNQALHDKYDQLNAEHKILEGKNNRLWELVNNLEKKNEDLSAENSYLKLELVEFENKLLDNVTKQHSIIKPKDEKPIIIKDVTTCEEITKLTKEIEQQKMIVTDLKVQIKVEKLQKEELDFQLQDEINGNQILHKKIAELNKEVLEWESFAQKEECYRRIAEAFTRKHNIEVEETIVHNLNHHTNAHFLHPLSPGSLSKAKSCEFLSYVPKSPHHKQNIIKSSNMRNTLFTTGYNNSILSELDKEYDDLVKRYEALLEKCKQEGRFTENPERKRKVQRAIQTLSLDFSTLTTPIQSPTKLSKSPSACDKCFSVNFAKSTPDMHEESSCDYKTLFSQIFQKLKESKEDSITASAHSSIR